MVYLRLRSIVGLAPLIESIVAGPSDHTLSLKSVNGSSSSSGFSPTSGNLPSSSHSLLPHPSETAALNNQVANLTDGPRFQCLSKYGATLIKQSCSEALESIPEDSRPWIFGRRTRPNVQFGLPYRFLSVDGTCAIDVGMGSFGAADADIGSWAQIRDAAQRIIGDCVEGSASRYPGLGGINRYLGHYGRLHVIVRSYEPSVECYEREFDGRHCQQTLFGMHTSSNMMNWRPEGTPPIGRPNIFVPKSYSDPTNSCFATITFSFGEYDQGSYMEMWEGANAVFWMCARHNHDGISTGHGRNGRLQVYLGWQESITSGVDTQR